MFFKKKQSEQFEGRRRSIPTNPARSSTVFSYHANRALRDDNPGRSNLQSTDKILKRRQRQDWLRRTPNLLIAGTLLLLFLFSLHLNPDVKVLSLGDSNSQIFLRPSSTYQTAAHDAFASSILNTNKITVNTQGVQARLRQQFPELNAVSISLPLLGDRPVVYIQPSAPRLLLNTKSDGLFIIDSSGRALISANQVKHLERLNLPVVTDESGLNVDAGKGALSGHDVGFITEVLGQLTTKKISWEALALPSGKSELDVKIRGAPYSVKFNLHGDARVEAGAFIAVYTKLNGEHKIPHEYVDVRAENKAYYK